MIDMKSKASLIAFAKQGAPPAASERFPDGCDWHKPPGCTCRLLAQADACYEGCNIQHEQHPLAITPEEYTVAISLLACIAIVLTAVFLIV